MQLLWRDEGIAMGRETIKTVLATCILIPYLSLIFHVADTSFSFRYVPGWFHRLRAKPLDGSPQTHLPPGPAVDHHKGKGCGRPLCFQGFTQGTHLASRNWRTLNFITACSHAPWSCQVAYHIGPVIKCELRCSIFASIAFLNYYICVRFAHACIYM